MDLHNYIKTVKDFPKKGISFKDISPILANPQAFEFLIDEIIKQHDFSQIDKIAGFDARGFLFGPTLAMKTQKPFIMIRKKGKLPGITISENYGLEYGTDSVEIQIDAITKGDKILLLDDLLATGGTAKAGCDLIEKQGGDIIALQVIIHLIELEGAKKLEKYRIKSILEY